LKLGRAARKQLAESIAGAGALGGDFFRSVAFRHFHPDDVISGEGTRLSGGRPGEHGGLDEQGIHSAAMGSFYMKHHG